MLRRNRGTYKLREKVKKHEKKEDSIYKKLEKENKKFEKKIK